MQVRLPTPTDVREKTVLVRVDFNVPMKEQDGRLVIEDDLRIRATLPTIQFLLDNRAKIILISHLGRPEGKFEAKYSMGPVAYALREQLSTNIQMLSHCVGESVEFHASHLQPGDILLLENLRFNVEEEENDPEFAAKLAKLADVYINDAFSVSHRAHASVAAITELLPSFAGFNLAEEVRFLSQVRDNPQRPLVVVIGGAKISDKVEAVKNLAEKADLVLTGGGVANNFLKADGLEIHKSYLQDAPADLKKKGVDYVHVAKDLLEDAKTSRVWIKDYIPVPKILYPLDVVAAQNMESTAGHIIDLTSGMEDTPDDEDLMYLDIGPKTVKLYQEIIATAGTVFWNGPMGVFEQPQFSEGTKHIARAIAAMTGQAETVIGGGDTLAAIEQFGMKDAYTFVSTAGGASLDFLAGKEMPGLQPLLVSSDEALPHPAMTSVQLPVAEPPAAEPPLAGESTPGFQTDLQTALGWARSAMQRPFNLELTSAAPISTKDVVKADVPTTADVAPDIDQLVYQAHFGSQEEQARAQQHIRQLAETQGARPASLHEIYRARGKGEVPANFTVPAFNLRGLSYLTAQAAFEAAQELSVELVIFELARSEMRYTGQTPAQLASSVLGAAVKTGWRGPVYIQGDHYQPKAAEPGQIKDGEVDSIQQLIRDSIAAGFYNLDVDGSTLVDPNQHDDYDQQRPNYLYTAEMIRFIRELAPAGVTINIGCEISEVGSHLSSSSQLAAFMVGLHLEGRITPDEYPTKVAIETGTAHGGVVNPDGTPGAMHVDFDRLRMISILARHKYQMAGAVQHGASTLDPATFGKFPEYEAAEIHLSTGFQNAIMDHPAFPAELKRKMYQWCDMHAASERKPNWTDAQFYIKLRKKAWGPFKEETWNIPRSSQEAIKETLKKDCRMYYESLGVADSATPLAKISKELQQS